MNTRQLLATLGLCAFPATGESASGQGLGRDERSEKRIALDMAPRIVIEGAQKELADIRKVELVTLRDGNKRYEFKGRDRLNRTMILMVDPEGGILAVRH